MKRLALVLPLFLVSIYGWHVASRNASTDEGQAVIAAGLTFSNHKIETAPPVIVIPETPEHVLRASLGKGGTLGAALEHLGLGPGERSEVIRRLGEGLDLRRLSPETGLVVVSDAGGPVRRVAVRTEADRFLRVHLEPAGAGRLEVVDLPLETVIETAAGEIDHSVERSLAHGAGGRQLALAFADIFQWDIDLLVDPRVGDRVRAVFEIQLLGQTPDDLPAFGDAPMREGERLRLGRILAASYEGRVASSTAFWVEHEPGRGSYFDAEGRPLRKTFLRSPLNYRRISSGFSRARRHPVTRKVVPHHGVDFAAAAGTPVVASAGGTVVSAGWAGALGRAIRVRHGSHYETVYGHLRGMAKGIRPGVEVEQNQVIGYVGSTGRATGPHLHYTLIERGRAIDPMRFANPPADPLPPELLPLLAEALEIWTPLLASARVPPQPRS